MAAVYSTQLVAASGVSGGPIPAFTVPAGKVAVVKFMTITVGLNLVPCWGAFKQSSSGGIIHSFGLGVADVPSHDKQTYPVYCTVVLEPGEDLLIETSSCTCDFAAGGYLLSLP